MATVVEDGTGLANATSLVALADIRAFGLARGIAVTDDDTELEIMVTKSIDYLKSREREYSGERLNPPTQALPWPRTGQYINDAPVPDGTVPQEAKDYQMTVVLAVNSGVVFFPTNPGADTRAIKRKKVGPLETEWFEGGSSSGAYGAAIDAVLWPLLGGSGAFALTLRRI